MLWRLSLSGPLQLPARLGDLESESRTIAFSLSIFWTYKTLIFGKIWTFAEDALLSGTLVTAKNPSKSPELEILRSKWIRYTHIVQIPSNYMFYFQVN